MDNTNLTGYVLTTWDPDTGLPTWPVAYGIGTQGCPVEECTFRQMPGTSNETAEPWLQSLSDTPKVAIEEALADFVDQSPAHGYIPVTVPHAAPRQALESLLDDILASFIHSRR